MDQIVIKKCYLLSVYNWKSHFSWTTQLQTLILHTFPFRSLWMNLVSFFKGIAELLIVSALWLSNLERASEYLGHVQVRLE